MYSHKSEYMCIQAGMMKNVIPLSRRSQNGYISKHTMECQSDNETNKESINFINKFWHGKISTHAHTHSILSIKAALQCIQYVGMLCSWFANGVCVCVICLSHIKNFKWVCSMVQQQIWSTHRHRRRPTSHTITINCLMKVLRNKDKGKRKWKTANRKRWKWAPFTDGLITWHIQNRTNGFVHNLKVCHTNYIHTATFVIGVFAFAFDFWLWHCYAFLKFIFVVCEFHRAHAKLG